MSKEGLKIRDNKTELCILEQWSCYKKSGENLILSPQKETSHFSLQHSPESNIKATRIKEMISN